METGEIIASSVFPLLVALLNLLVSGYALAEGREDRSKLAFAAGPAGVGIWAIAWFISVFDPEALDAMRSLAGYGGLIAIGGFAIDALSALPARRAFIVAGAAVLLSLLGVLSVQVLFGAVYDVDLPRTAVRLFACAGIGVVAVARLPAMRSPISGERRFARLSVGVIAAAVLGYLVFAAVAFTGGRQGVDPLLLVVLVAESLALAYIGARRVEVHVLLSRAVTYAILSLAVALAAAGAFRALGYQVDLVLVAMTVSLALFAGLLFMGLSEVMARQVERVLFPDRARLTVALQASKGELAAIRRRLARAEKLAIAGELAAQVAHEIKNPLAPIRGYAQLLGGKLDSVDPAARDLFAKGLRIVQEESDRIDGRIKELLKLSRAERVTASSEETFDLPRVLVEAIAVAEGDAPSIAIVQDLDPRLGKASGNGDEMRGAVLNLLKNAIEAMAGTDGARIEVRARLEGKTAVIEVRDEGPGLGEEEAEKAFDAFYTTKPEGTGLGLAIARSAVEAAGGRISIGSRKDRRGALVRVEVPAPEEIPAVAAPAAKEAS